MEAALVNTLSPGDSVMFVNGGKFGERWGEIARAFGLVTHEISVEWGTAVTAERLIEELEAHPDAKAVLLTHSETSTGVFTDIKALTLAIRPRFDGLVIVDGITAVGAHEMRFDDWDLDIVVTGSQKGLMIPPGLAFIALSERAWRATKSARIPRYYLDLGVARTALESNDTPWTPAITLLLGVADALTMIRTEGIENVWRRHDRLGMAMRAAGTALGLRLFGNPPSNALTSIMLPEKGKEFMKLLKETYSVTVAGGQGSLKGKIFRVSHLGYYDDADMLSVIYMMERALSDVGHPFTLGAGLAAAMQVFNS